MGRIGSYDYPEIELSKAIEIVKLISTRLGGKVENQQALADVLGHSTTKSGGFAIKVIGTKRYGLLAGRGSLQVTKLGERLAFPNDKEEEMSAIEEAVNSIPLFKRIRDSVGFEPSESTFRAQLTNITNANRADSDKHWEKVLKLYKDATKYLIDRKDITEKRKEEQVDTMQGCTPPILTGEGFAKFESSNCFIRIKENDPEALSFAKGVLGLLEKKSEKPGKGQGK